jgi:hypothetical protein
MPGVTAKAPVPRKPQEAAPSTEDERETLADWLAPGHGVEGIEGLGKLLRATAVLRGFAGLFAGGNASLQARALMLRMLGQRDDPPEWSPAEIERQFAWLDATKRDTTLKRLNEHGLLTWDAPSRTYRLSSIGRIVLLAVEQVLRVVGESDASGGEDLRFIAGQLQAERALGFEQLQSLQLMLGRMVELQESFALALASGSETRLQQASDDLDRVAPRMAQATELLKRLMDDGLPGDRAYRTAQRIGKVQSELMRSGGMLGRSLAEMARQRVTLSQAGITDAELKRWLFEQPVQAWLDAAVAPASMLLAPVFVAGDVALDVAESQLAHERVAADTPLPQAVDIAQGELEVEPLPPQFDAWLVQLQALAQAATPATLASCVPHADFVTSAYRLSLLGLLGERVEDPDHRAFTELPLRVTGGQGTADVQDHGVARISDSSLERS